MKRPCVRPSVRKSVPTCDRSVRRVCCWAPCGRKISIEGLNSLELYALSKRLTSDTSMSSLIVFSWNYLRLATWILSETVNNFFDFELPSIAVASTHTHTHPFNGPLPGTTRVSRYQKGETNLDFTEARDSEWQWHPQGRMQVCTSLQSDNHAITPPLSFLRTGCPSCRPTNSVKAQLLTEMRNLFKPFHL